MYSIVPTGTSQERGTAASEETADQGKATTEQVYLLCMGIL